MLPRSVQDQADTAKALQDNLNQLDENPAEATPVEQQSQQEKPEAQPAKEQQNETRDAAYWRHRFDVLQGKYNAEVPALRKEVSTLSEQIKAASEQQPESAVERAQGAMHDLTEDEIEEYGPDLINLIQRVAGGAAKAGGDDDLQKVKSELGRMREEQQQDAEARFWVELEAQIPNFREVNSDPSFHKWLSEIDTLSGLERQQLLVDGQQALDPYRVAAIFRSFASTPAAQAASTETIPDELIQPQQTRAATPTAQQGKIWSRAEISAFYKDKARYSKEEASAIEADIFAAQSQGRIR